MKGKNVIAYAGLIVIIGILSFMLLAPKHLIQMSAKYDHTQIAVSYAIPNSEQVASAKLMYVTYYLENYKNVSPEENEIELVPNGDIQYITFDTYDFLAKQDRMDLIITVTYNDGKTLTKTHKLEHFFEAMVSDALVPSERHADRTVYEIEDIEISLQTSDLPEDLVVYKSLSDIKRFFYMGYRMGNYLYPIRTFVIDTNLNGDSEVDLQWERIKFENQDEIDLSERLSKSSSKLYELPMISLDWVGRYPFDSKGELIPYESPNKEAGFVLIDGDFHSELFDVSYQQYTKWSQEIPAISFTSTMKTNSNTEVINHEIAKASLKNLVHYQPLSETLAFCGEDRGIGTLYFFYDLIEEEQLIIPILSKGLSIVEQYSPDHYLIRSKGIFNDTAYESFPLDYDVIIDQQGEVVVLPGAPIVYKEADELTVHGLKQGEITGIVFTLEGLEIKFGPLPDDEGMFYAAHVDVPTVHIATTRDDETEKNVVVLTFTDAYMGDFLENTVRRSKLADGIQYLINPYFETSGIASLEIRAEGNQVTVAIHTEYENVQYQVDKAVFETDFPYLKFQLVK